MIQCTLNHHLFVLNSSHIVKVRPQFTDRKMNNFMVIRAGNSARVNFNFKVCYNIHTKLYEYKNTKGFNLMYSLSSCRQYFSAAQTKCINQHLSPVSFVTERPLQYQQLHGLRMVSLLPSM